MNNTTGTYNSTETQALFTVQFFAVLLFTM